MDNTMRNHVRIVCVCVGLIFSVAYSKFDASVVQAAQNNPDDAAKNRKETLASQQGIAAQTAVVPLPKEACVDLGDGVKMEFVLIQSGTFMMGAKPGHMVTLTRPFYLGKYEVTQSQWERIMGNNPSSFKAGQKPVENVSWDDCQIFVAKLKEKVAGQTFRLPTEAEWEYACRAGTTTWYGFGESEALIDEYAWYSNNSGATTHPVGQKKPNTWGLYDMHGNVWEWCADWYGDYPRTAVSDPIGPASGDRRIFRSGGWRSTAMYCLSPSRNMNYPDYRSYSVGVRLLQTVP